ncbi:DUF4834 family protein [Flavobacterium sp. MAH-1]|uniref:DUF4834 family protein n=1 Tax=Flavobacterium agri TaxID=2743471 RepID=A0A7Y9C5M2_9FLAO|nr:DUF4834 family protein [Flavobacterium agri]NUY79308.1 DUF4834 family protein [Flavobacterium agri]NYA69332.1 DUF4834 family protein [Flavobacterium agri]
MEMASFSNFLRTLVYIIAFYYILRFLSRLLFPILVKKAVEHAQDDMRQQFGSYQNPNDNYRRNDGEVTVDASNAPKSKETKKVGEYIDYEEID